MAGSIPASVWRRRFSVGCGAAGPMEILGMFMFCSIRFRSLLLGVKRETIIQQYRYIRGAAISEEFRYIRDKRQSLRIRPATNPAKLPLPGEPEPGQSATNRKRSLCPYAYMILKAEYLNE